MHLIRSLFLAAALLTPAVATAAPEQSAPLPSEIRLSDEEKEKVLEAAAARKREHVAPTAEELGSQPVQVHGEVGVTLGTGGYRSIYGTVFTPLDGDGFAAMSFETTDFGKKDRYFDPWLR
ncbi:hypothetical protein LZ518_00285 [Sphingomonas sp. RB56-2]|uniref:Uncharacterized protein n=1 Tax=Sphingomonas brevis TaxID=2908206 RepID=A0ABT0S5Y8_9SPHN|nr:hypothetical protein [Sphingomonas brevis]MCL6739580.1 hypothetical protein [Sphingomonas brevis]